MCSSDLILTLIRFRKLVINNDINKVSEGMGEIKEPCVNIPGKIQSIIDEYSEKLQEVIPDYVAIDAPDNKYKDKVFQDISVCLFEMVNELKTLDSRDLTTLESVAEQSQISDLAKKIVEYVGDLHQRNNQVSTALHKYANGMTTETIKNSTFATRVVTK